MNDINFVQKYNAILLDNFDAVLKQNLLFQTKIGILEEQVAKLEDVEKLKHQINILIKDNTDLRNDLTFKQNEMNLNLKDTAELHRLQAALNKQAKELSVLQKNDKEQKAKIKELEKLVPKVKKQPQVEATLEVEPIQKEETTNTLETF